jgi:hypothetical protein
VTDGERRKAAKNSRVGHFRESLRRRRGDIGRRLHLLPLVAGICAAVVAYILAPAVDRSHPAERLQGIFGASLAAMVAIVIAIGLLQLAPTRQSLATLRFLNFYSLFPIGLAIVASIAGLLPSLDSLVYRFLFAITIGGGADCLVVMFLVISMSLTALRDKARRKRAGALAPADDRDTLT